MSLKKSLFALSFIAAFCLSACDSDSSTSASNDNKMSSAGTFNNDVLSSTSSSNSDIFYCTFTEEQNNFKMVVTLKDTLWVTQGNLTNDVVNITSTVNPAPANACADVEPDEICTVENGVEKSVQSIRSVLYQETYNMTINGSKYFCDQIDGMTQAEAESKGLFD